jgi:hypothetical protein
MQKIITGHTFEQLAASLFYDDNNIIERQAASLIEPD